MIIDSWVFLIKTSLRKKTMTDSIDPADNELDWDVNESVHKFELIELLSHLEFCYCFI